MKIELDSFEFSRRLANDGEWILCDETSSFGESLVLLHIVRAYYKTEFKMPPVKEYNCTSYTTYYKESAEPLNHTSWPVIIYDHAGEPVAKSMKGSYIVIPTDFKP